MDAFKPKSLEEMKKSAIQIMIEQLISGRRAARSLKNYKEPAVIEALAPGLSDGDVSVRRQCARSLWHLNKAAAAAKPALKKALGNPSMRVRIMAAGTWIRCAASLFPMNLRTPNTMMRSKN